LDENRENNMKILQLSTSFKPAWETGGTNRVAYEISKNLVEKGHEVTVFTTDRGRKRVNIQKNQPVFVDGIRAYYFRNISNVLAMKKIVTPYYLPIIANKEVKDFDVIHIHEHRTLLAVIIYHYAKKYKIPYVLQAHGSVLPFFQKERLKKNFDLSFGYRILRDASKVIALTKTEVEQYKKMGVNEDKIEIVPNGIDLSEYENLPKKGEFRRKYLIKDDEKIILYIGRLHKSKGIELLVKTFADVSKELDNVRLVFVGPDDGFRSALENLIEDLKVNDKVLFTGFVSNNEKMAAFVDADVFVTPKFSGFPVTFLEACACGTPIITTEKGDKLDWIHDKVGYVVEYDKNQLRDAIFRVLSDEGLRRRFGEKGKKLVMEKFGWDNVVLDIEQIYLRLIQ
jgi:glycosyltransferase involved in cell wall biosynthesis